jgi:hypothetical protein
MTPQQLAEAVRALAADQCASEKVAGLDAERIAHNEACDDCADAIRLIDLSAIVAAHGNPTPQNSLVEEAICALERPLWDQSQRDAVASYLRRKLASQDANQVQRSATVGPCENGKEKA